jgi:hypothetical protein
MKFRNLLKTLDSLSCELHKQGVVVKHTAKVIDFEHEAIFWEKSLLGYSTPKILQCTVFFYVGLILLLWVCSNSMILFPHSSFVCHQIRM